MNKQLLGLVLLGTSVAVNATVSDNATVHSMTKIGYISASSILNDSKIGKQLKKDLDQKYEAIARELQAEEQRLVKVTNDLKVKQTTLSETAFEAEQDKAKEMVRKYQAMRQEKEEEFKVAEQKANERLIKETLDVAATIGQQDNYDAIIDRESGKVLWTASKNDCTSKLLAGLDKKFDQNINKGTVRKTA